MVLCRRSPPARSRVRTGSCRRRGGGPAAGARWRPPRAAPSTAGLLPESLRQAPDEKARRHPPPGHYEPGAPIGRYRHPEGHPERGDPAVGPRRAVVAAAGSAPSDEARGERTAGTPQAGRPKVLWDGPPLLLRQRYAAGLTLRERSGRWRLRCLGLILARTAAASQGWTERVASSCGDALLGRASSVLPERCRPA